MPSNQNIKKVFFLILASIGVSFTTACYEVKTADGEIKQEYVPYVKPYVGRYVGKVDGKETEITIEMNGKAPEVKVHNAFGDDIIAEDCRSQIGKLRSFKAKKVADKKYALEKATFQFDPGFCENVEGRSVVLEMLSATEFQVSILEKDKRTTVCPTTSGRGPADAPCNEVGEVSYVRGTFIKK